MNINDLRYLDDCITNDKIYGGVVLNPSISDPDRGVFKVFEFCGNFPGKGKDCSLSNGNSDNNSSLVLNNPDANAIQ